MKSILQISLLLLSTFSFAQVKQIKVPNSDSVIVINITEIQEEARRVAEKAARIAAEQQKEEMELIFKNFSGDFDFESLEDLNIEIDQEEIERSIREAEAQVRMQEAEIRRALSEVHKERKYQESTIITNFSVSHEGEIKLNEEEDNIISISEGGKFVVKKRTFGNTRKLVIIPNQDGSLSYKYYEGNQLIPFDPDGKNWLKDILPEVINSSSIAAEDRLNRQLKEGGISQALKYIGDLSSDHTKVVFYKLLVNNKKVNQAKLDEITTHLSKNVSSSYNLADYYSSSLITYYNKKGLDYYFDGIKSISSSYDKSKCLKDIIDQKEVSKQFSNKEWDLFCDVVKDISSGYDKSKTIIYMFENSESEISADRYTSLLHSISSSYDKRQTIQAAFESLNHRLTDAQRDAIISEVRYMSSSSDKSGTLLDIVDYWNDLSRENKLSFFKSAATVSSSYDLRKVLEATIDEAALRDDEVIKAFYLCATKISSSYDLRSTLTVSLDSDGFITDHISPLLLASQHISSSYDLRSVLEEAAQYVSITDAQLYYETAQKISSSYDLRSVLEEAISQDRFSYDQLPFFLEAAKKITSSYDLSSTLEEAAPLVVASKNEDYKNKYIEVAKKISSTSERNAVLGALFE
ncbi:hypothetical protein [Flammeovirga agarivorans]|uniref:Uncharacterized protein n=1 Tax=Flammeovirga agarivorans TaxID=2726742 RepID=A0A7X8SKV8_9BACT|nr:hypothetical protein [Flammeovirga agarivorans]NLR92091.1 hypothetical protein [Flammeovirga agarivorans]